MGNTSPLRYKLSEQKAQFLCAKFANSNGLTYLQFLDFNLRGLLNKRRYHQSGISQRSNI